MVLATVRSTGKHKAEQKVNGIDEWILVGLAARTVTGVQIIEGCVHVFA